jgi:hypothetical protein
MDARLLLKAAAVNGAAGCLLAACATGPSEPESPTAAAWATVAYAEAVLAGTAELDVDGPVTGDELVCRKEAPVRSHFERRRCFTRDQLDEITREAHEWLRSGGRYGSVITTR